MLRQYAQRFKELALSQTPDALRFSRIAAQYFSGTNRRLAMEAMSS
jgi:hypothetical protein